MGATESEILATNSYLYFPYSEEDKIELDININAHQVGSDNNFIMSYEDGVPSKAYAYTYGLSGDSIYHDNTIRIGSPDCDVYIYRLRIYKNALETADILQNFIADGKDINEKVSRYNRNCIYWDDQQEQYFTSPSGTAILDPTKLAERLPNVKILMLDTPVFTVGKKNFVQGSTLRCIQECRKIILVIFHILLVAMLITGSSVAVSTQDKVLHQITMDRALVMLTSYLRLMVFIIQLNQRI